MVEISRRSTLELLLDSIKEKNEVPPDKLPALPQRPTSRGRLPSTSRMRKANSFGAVAATFASRNESFATAPNDSLGPTQNNLRQSAHHSLQSNGEKVDAEDLDYEPVPQNYTRNDFREPLINAVDGVDRNRAVARTLSVSALNKEVGRMINVRRNNDGLVRGRDESEGLVNNSEGSAKDLLEYASTESSNSVGHLQQSSTENQENAFVYRRKRRRDDWPFGLRKGSQVWFLSTDNNWMRGSIQAADHREAILKTANDENKRVSSKELLLVNPEILDGVDDLVRLSYIHKPAIMHNLQIRYAQDNIYTSAGSMLIAVNPFKEVQIHKIDSFKACNRKSKGGSGPHVLKVAENAREAMIKDGVNQSIILSGDSAAGKTESARLTMQYLLAAGGAEAIGNIILQANSILETFGNAKTLGNRNGSRFGKVVKIYFEDSGRPCGANFQIGCLEKSRIVHRLEEESSFHIFYQLCEGADLSLREHLNLRSAKEFQYLNQSGCFDNDYIDHKAQFRSLRNAMDSLGISEKEQESIFALLVGILWLGDVVSHVVEDDNSLFTLVDEAVRESARAFRCSEEQLLGALCMENCSSIQVEIMPRCTYSQVVYARDALAKYVYEGLFEWLVARINKSLGVEKGVSFNYISILDNPGFQPLQKSGPDQLYINYSNELLRYHIRACLFQDEQEDCNYEGIDCTKTSILNNEDCIQLFEKGLFPLLDAECKSADRTDCSFLKELTGHVEDHSHFADMEIPQFGICHDTTEVTCDATDFMAINRDLVSLDVSEISSLCMRELTARSHSKTKYLEGSLLSQNQNIISRWKNQFLQVMHHLDNTAKHFILCIKPNKSQSPASYEQDLVMQQLHSYGVLEAVRAFRYGFQTRLHHQMFASRFSLLLTRSIVEKQDAVSICVAALQQCGIPPQMYCVGLTKIFLRDGQINILEHTRKRFLQQVISVQKLYRGYKLRCDFRKKRRAIVFLQAWIRGWLMRKGQRNIMKENKKTSVAEQKLLSKTVPIQEETDIFRAEIDRMGHMRDQNFSAEVSHTGVQREKEGITVTSSVGGMGSQLSNAEAALRESKNENALLQQSLQEYKRRWSEYESKMKSMEDMWQKQIASLQQSLSAGKKSMLSEDVGNETLKQSDLQNVVATQQGLQGTQIDSANTGNMKTSLQKSPQSVDVSVNRGELDPSRPVLDHLAKEFEHRTQVFNDDVDFLVEVKSGHSEANFKPDVELQKLKQRFDIWKKDYKSRLRETKGILKKLGKSGSVDRNWTKWWGKKPT